MGFGRDNREATPGFHDESDLATRACPHKMLCPRRHYLTIDIDPVLHTDLKISCAKRGIQMPSVLQFDSWTLFLFRFRLISSETTRDRQWFRSWQP